MNPISSATRERSRKFLALALQRVSSVGQRNIAEQLSTSESTISRLVSTELERVCQLLEVVGLKVVPQELKCYEPRKIAILHELAREYLNKMDAPDSLSFDD